MNHLRSKLPRPNSAFTLIELLTVIAIIGILAAIIIPTVGKVRQSAKSTQCLSNLRQIGMAFNLYPSDNKGRFPRTGLNPRPTDPSRKDALWYSAITPYIQNSAIAATNAVYRCPSEEAQVDPARINSTVQYTASRALERSGSATLVTGVGAKPEEIPNISRTFLVIDSWVNQTGASTGISPHGTLTYAQLTTSISGTPDASTTVSYRHNSGVNVVFVDGHTARLSFDEFKSRVADPITGRKLWDPFGL